MRAFASKCFNPRLFFEAVKRLRVIGIAIAILALGTAILIPSLTWVAQQRAFDRRMEHYREGERYEAVEDVYTEKPYGDDREFLQKPGEFLQKPEIKAEPVEDYLLCLPLYTLPFSAPLFFLLLFSFLHKRKESDFYHAIPYTRTCVYISFASGALAMVFAIAAGSALLSGLIYAICPFTTFALWDLVSALLLSMLSAAFLASFMMLALSVTGTSATTLLLFGLFASITRVIMGLFGLCVDTLTVVSSRFYPFLSIDWYLPFRVFRQGSDYSNTALPSYSQLVPYTLIVTLLLFTLAGIFYKRRRSEMAERSAPSRRMQSVFRCLFTLPFALILATLLVADGATDFQIVIVLLALILAVFYLYELITTKRPKNMLKATPWLLAVAGGALLYVFCFGAFTMSVHRPIPENEIKSVSVQMKGRNTYESLQTATLTTEDASVIEVVADALKDTIGYETNGFPRIYDESKGGYTPHQYTTRNVVITMKSGIKVTRFLYFSKDQEALLNKHFFSSAEYLEQYLKLPPIAYIDSIHLESEGSSTYYGSSYITDTEMRGLWDILAREYAALSPEEQYRFKSGVLDTTNLTEKPGTTEGFPDNGGVEMMSSQPFGVSVRLSGAMPDGTSFHSGYMIQPAMVETLSYYFTTIVNARGSDYYNSGLKDQPPVSLSVSSGDSPEKIAETLFTHLGSGACSFYTGKLSIGKYGDLEMILKTGTYEEHFSELFNLLAVYSKNRGSVSIGTVPVQISAAMYTNDGSASADVMILLYLTESEYKALLTAAHLKS
jgi:hypothetical protein